MTISELIEELKTHDGTKKVFISYPEYEDMITTSRIGISKPDQPFEIFITN